MEVSVFQTRLTAKAHNDQLTLTPVLPVARVLQLPILDGDESVKDNKLMVDSGTEDELSLAITMALPGQLQLLGGFVGMYAEFDGRLGSMRHSQTISIRSLTIHRQSSWHPSHRYDRIT